MSKGKIYVWRWMATCGLALSLLCAPGRPAGIMAGQAMPPATHTNRLIGETSPYLLEHAHNPVNWYPWGKEALERAEKEKKPIFLSIGYSACHWCHVMAREDFENEAIARILNDNFVCIKVDREQRPDIDAQYMLAVQLMTGSGGWPLSVFLTPDRKPFFGGTYFPPEQFTSLLHRVIEVYSKQQDEIQAQADKVTRAVATAGGGGKEIAGKLASDVATQAVTQMRARFDTRQGGFSQRPKFPEAPNLAFLLNRYRLNQSRLNQSNLATNRPTSPGKPGDRATLDMVTTTLDRMADGGIYDQIGGGFHRYSTDAIWRVPHFEKMLYDQAQLVPIYLDAYAITHNPRYQEVATETLNFVSREMRDAAGGFTSTLDADSEGEEGKFYLWTPEELHQALGADASLFAQRYGVTATGDMEGKTEGKREGKTEGKSVLHIAASLVDLARQHHLSRETLATRLDGLRHKLLAARARRIRPHTDDKVLASWNGLMIYAYAHAARMLNQPAYRQIATEAAEFLTNKMMRDGTLLHSYRAGKADVPGLLEDYAFVTYGLLELHAAQSPAMTVPTADSRWLDVARKLATQMVTLFEDGQNGGFFGTAEQGDLLTRLKEAQDNATPSGNGVAALALARLASLSTQSTTTSGTKTGAPNWRGSALRTVQAFRTTEERVPSAFPSLLTAWENLGGATALSVAPETIVQLTAEPIHGMPGETITFTLKAHIREGWHINSHDVLAAEVIPSNLFMTGSPYAQLVEIRYPTGQKTALASIGTPLVTYQNDVALQVTVRLNRVPRSKEPGKSPAGSKIENRSVVKKDASGDLKRRLEFVLSYQPCNDRACLAPEQARGYVIIVP